MAAAPEPSVAVHRIEVRPRSGAADPRGDEALHLAATAGIEPLPARIESAGVYLVQAALTNDQVDQLARELLGNPVSEEAIVGAAPPRGDALVEVHPLPGVMDPDAESIELAIASLLGVEAVVRTGRRFDLYGIDGPAARVLATRCLANTVVHGVHERPWQPGTFPAGTAADTTVRTVRLSGLDDEALLDLSRRAHLFLDLEEMRTIREAYRGLGRDPREIELETLAQTWSEHCVHKTLKATIRYEGDLPRAAERPGHVVEDDGTITIRNLLGSTVVAATKRLMDEGAAWCLSVFVDNAGVIAFDDEHAVCAKVETHNHPTAIEPYGGAATGIGGCIRDVMGTGLAAKPIAATDVFCVGRLDGPAPPAGCLHPARVLTQVVAGVRDYGNRMGIPTCNGAVWFDDDHVGNPLVFCGCIGVMPRDLVHGEPTDGDRIIAVGGRTGRDGIHGATFSSAELTDTHADEFAHAVQIGNPVTEKKALDAILEARDAPGGCLFSAITDCGAGGFSSAVGEMGETLGAVVHLDRAPLKYEGLTPTEIWISEAQERMVLAVPEANVEALQAICAAHDVASCDLGRFGTPGKDLVLLHGEIEVGRLSMALLHAGRPTTWREAIWSTPEPTAVPIIDLPSVETALRSLLSHPNIASKRTIIRQYDHEVQGRAVINPLVGPLGEGPSDAAVFLPVADSTRGLALACGLATGLRRDPYWMVLAAIDECVRNLVCVGADPDRIALLDNFCWPTCDDPAHLGGLVRAAEACYDGAVAHRAPFISGKDSLNNQFTTEDGRTIRIPPTLLITGLGIVPDIRRCVTMDAKEAGNCVLVVGETTAAMGGSHHAMLHGRCTDDDALPEADLVAGPVAARAVHRLLAAGLVCAAHDCSEGGLLVAAAELAFAGDLGLHLDLADLPGSSDLSPTAHCFAETPGRWLLEVSQDNLNAVSGMLDEVPWGVIGTLQEAPRLVLEAAGLDVAIDDLRTTWMEPIDW